MLESETTAGGDDLRVRPRGGEMVGVAGHGAGEGAEVAGMPCWGEKQAEEGTEGLRSRRVGDAEVGRAGRK